MTRGRRGGRTGARAGASCATCQPAGEPVPPTSSYEINNCEYCETKLYAGLSDRQVKELDGRLGLSRSEPRHMLFRAGESTKYLYLVREGQVKLTRTDIDGHEHLLNLVGRGYFLGFDAIGNTTYSYNAETLTPTIYHYWYHIGENLAIRQQLGHASLPQFVGNIDRQAPYRPEGKR